MTRPTPPPVPRTGVQPPTVAAGAAIAAAARTAAGGTQDAGSALLDSLNPFSGLDDSLTAVRAWISDRHNWVRVSWTIGGFSMLFLGVLMIGSRPAAKAAAQASQLTGGKL